MCSNEMIVTLVIGLVIQGTLHPYVIICIIKPLCLIITYSLRALCGKVAGSNVGASCSRWCAGFVLESDQGEYAEYATCSQSLSQTLSPLSPVTTVHLILFSVAS